MIPIAFPLGAENLISAVGSVPDGKGCKFTDEDATLLLQVAVRDVSPKA